MLNNKNGAISLFAILSTMFFLIFIMVAYNNVMQKSKVQKETEGILVDYYKPIQNAAEISSARDGGNVKLANLKDRNQKLEVLKSNSNTTYIYSNGYCYKANNNVKDYQQVEYIESTGTQYIDTGVSPNTTTIWELKVMRTSTSYMWNGSYAIDQRFRIDNNSFGLGRGFRYEDPSVGEELLIRWDANVPEISKNGETKVDREFTAFSNSVNIYLFAQNNDNSSVSYGVSRIYYSKMWKDGELVRDFIPCYRISDNTIGLYDLVNDVFYINKGTGTFIKGPEV